MHKTIAVDFDGCLCENRWPEIGNPIWPTIRKLQERQAEGDRVILWTCREGEALEQALMWCQNHGVRFDEVNRNLEEHIRTYGNDCRKVFADEYWDDKAVQRGEIFYERSVGAIYIEKGGPMPSGIKARLKFLFTGRM